MFPDFSNVKMQEKNIFLASRNYDSNNHILQETWKEMECLRQRIKM